MFLWRADAGQAATRQMATAMMSFCKLLLPGSQQLFNVGTQLGSNVGTNSWFHAMTVELRKTVKTGTAQAIRINGKAAVINREAANSVI